MFSLCEQGHYVKAKALSGLERTEEALKEFLYCVALNPEWSSMKKEAQKVSNVLAGCFLAITLLCGGAYITRMVYLWILLQICRLGHSSL